MRIGADFPLWHDGNVKAAPLFDETVAVLLGHRDTGPLGK